MKRWIEDIMKSRKESIAALKDDAKKEFNIGKVDVEKIKKSRKKK